MAILTNKISGLTKTKLIDLDSVISINSMNIANIHSSDSVSIDLYIASQIATDITDTGTDSAMEIIATTNSTTLTVDSTAATSDIFENEKVWKSDGTLFGTCTARNSNTEIVFGDGIVQLLANDDDFTLDFDVTDEIFSCGLTSTEQAFLVLRLEGLTMEEITDDLGEPAYKIRQSLRKKVLDGTNLYEKYSAL